MITTLDKRLHGDEPAASKPVPSPLTEIRDRLVAADAMLRGASTAPCLDKSMRRRLDLIAGHVMMELELVKIELDAG